MKALAFVSAAVVAAALPLASPAQTVIIPTGNAVATVAPGCLVRVVKGPYRKVMRTGTTELPTGTYRVKVRPSHCKAFPKRITVREGKKVRFTVLHDPVIVPRNLMATIEGSASVNGVTTATWEGDLSLRLNLPPYTSRTPGFETTASYRVQDFNGSYTIDRTADGCTLTGSGTLAYGDLLAEGEVAPVWSNPWQGFQYAMQVPFAARDWSYQRVCAETTTQTQAAPPLLFATNAWEGLTPVGPLNRGRLPAGTYTTTVGDTTYTYSWSFSAWDASEKRLSKPV